MTWTGNESEMAFFIFNGGEISDEEVQLSMPDASEAKNLNRHVERCAMRYKLFTKRQASQGQDIIQIKYMMIGLIAIVFLTAPQVRPLLDWLSKLL
jgi:hypothetical protein